MSTNHLQITPGWMWPNQISQTLPNGPLGKIGRKCGSSLHDIPTGWKQDRNTTTKLYNTSSNEHTYCDWYTPPRSATLPQLPHLSSPTRITRYKKDTTIIHLRPDTRTIVLSDSNLKYLREDDIPTDWQVEIIWGAWLPTHPWSNTETSIYQFPGHRPGGRYKPQDG